jgi:hypothetical protein
MPYATILNGEIEFTYTKPNPLVRLNSGERMVKYDPPEVDLDYFEVTPVIPVTGKSVEFTVTEKPQAKQLKVEKLLKQVDAQADKLYADAVGNLAVEYQQAEDDAKTYKAAGYAGAVPETLKGYMAATGLAAEAAANKTLSLATSWRSTVQAVRSERLAVKSSIRAGDFDLTAWETFLLNTRKGLDL